MKSIQEFSTDWIGSNPVFYNERTHAISSRMIDVIDWNNFEFDPEGLYNYLSFGYQVFDQTAVKNVRLLPHSSTIKQYQDENGNKKLLIEGQPDPIERYVGRKSTEEEVIELLRKHVATFEAQSQAKDRSKRFLLPLSGGYDSRLLATLIQDKSRIDAFTYDISLSERYSFEAIRAQEVCRRLGIKWHPMRLDQYWTEAYRERNFTAFGLEMPLQASYHMEMYDRIIREHGDNYIVLSGSVGDWWSGQKIPIAPPKDYLNFESLFFHHGISIPLEQIEINTSHEIKKRIFEKNIQRLREDELFRIVFSRRGRMGLATYIYRTAGLYCDVYTPFYDIDIALSQLNLPPDRRANRLWLQEFFSRTGLAVEDDKGLVTSNDYGLDIKTAYYTLQQRDLLNPLHFREMVKKERVEWINKQLMRVHSIPFPLLVLTSQMFFGIDVLSRKLLLRTIFGMGFDYIYRRLFRTADVFKAISEWTVLKPIEMAIEKANRS